MQKGKERNGGGWKTNGMNYKKWRRGKGLRGIKFKWKEKKKYYCHTIVTRRKKDEKQQG